MVVVVSICVVVVVVVVRLCTLFAYTRICRIYNIELHIVVLVVDCPRAWFGNNRTFFLLSRWR